MKKKVMLILSGLLVGGVLLGAMVCFGVYALIQLYVAPKTRCSREINEFKVEMVQETLGFGASSVYYYLYKDNQFIDKFGSIDGMIKDITYTEDLSGVDFAVGGKAYLYDLNRENANKLCGLTYQDTNIGKMLGDAFLYDEAQNMFHFALIDSDEVKFAQFRTWQILPAFREAKGDTTSVMKVTSQEVERTKQGYIITNTIDVTPIGMNQKTKQYTVRVLITYAKGSLGTTSVLNYKLVK